MVDAYFIGHAQQGPGSKLVAAAVGSLTGCAGFIRTRLRLCWYVEKDKKRLQGIGGLPGSDETFIE